MGTIGSAISQVKTDTKTFSSDSHLTDKYIWEKINDNGLLFLKQKNDRFNLSNSSFIYTTINCIEMCLVDSIDCCLDIPSCKILRSKKPIPKIAESNLAYAIKGIYTIDSGEKIDFVTENDIIRLSKTRYKSNGIKSFIKNDYLFIPFRKTPKAVAVSAYFQDPLEVYFFNECDKKILDYCTSYQDLEWKIPSDLRNAILMETVKSILGSYIQIPTDENTNKNENLK
jgi:hypothetical protein